MKKSVFIAVTEKSLVVQHNKIIEARYKLSVGEQRLVKLLVSMIEPDDEDFKKYRIHVADLAALLDIKRKDFYSAVMASTKKLIGNVLTFEMDGEVFQAAWLASAHYHKGSGSVDLQFAPLLKPFLLQLKKHFTSYELGNVIHLKHIYSIRIYELLKQYEKIGRRKFYIDNLRGILMLDDGQYKLYKDFKKYVLMTAKEELDEKTDISFEMIEERKWKTCVAIEFIINSKKRKETATKLEKPEIIKVENLEQAQDKQPDNPIISQLLTLGVTRKVAEELASEYGEEKIKAAIEYTQNQQKEGKVKNPGGFLVEAIKNEYRDSKAEERKRQEVALQEAKNKDAKARWWKAYKESYQKAKDAAFDNWFPKLDQKEVADYREKYMASLKGIVKERETIANIMFMNQMKSFMKFPSLREYGKMNNIDLTACEEELRQEELEQQRKAAEKTANGV
jgi:plasmid replication initiation protein